MVFIILPCSLYLPDNFDNNNIYLVEHPAYFIDYDYHKLKLILHRASMKNMQHKLKAKYIEFSDYKSQINKLFSKNKDITMYDPMNLDIISEFVSYAKKYRCKLTILDSLSFILTNKEVYEYADNRRTFLHSHFYKWIRTKTNTLMTSSNKPYGSKWSFDTENRKPFDKSIKKDVLSLKPKIDKYITEAKSYISKNFSNNPGSTNFYLPIDHKNAKLWFNNFLSKRFRKFGEFQDAVSSNIHVGYHSIISPLMNIGLLLPLDVIRKAEKYGKKHKIPISSIEGFIRQVLGWRELVRVVYLTKSNSLCKNYFGANRKLDKKAWYTGSKTTGFNFIDILINKFLETGYLHHIERLMYIGNYCLICKIHPKEIMNWFMCFIDSDIWVMLPNVYAMSQYASGPLMMTRPYFSSIAYIKKMSDFKISNEESILWNAIYYNFLHTHKDKLKKNYAVAAQIKHLNNKTSGEIKEIKQIANKYFREY